MILFLCVGPLLMLCFGSFVVGTPLGPVKSVSR